MGPNQYGAQASTNYKEAFSLFDTRGVGRVALEKLGDLLRACGQNPTLAEIHELEKSVGGECERPEVPGSILRAVTDSCATVDFETFQRILNRPGGFRDPGEPEEYCRGFQVFDKDMTGFIGVGQLKYILTNLGEKMTDEEVDELLKAVDTSSGQVNYTGMRPDFPGPLDFADNVLSRTRPNHPCQLRTIEGPAFVTSLGPLPWRKRKDLSARRMGI